MISAAFIFEPGTYDARFLALDAKIEAAAVATPGDLGAGDLAKRRRLAL